MKKLDNFEEIKKYLDKSIIYWRNKRDVENNQIAKYYIDAFQSVRTSIFGKTKE